MAKFDYFTFVIYPQEISQFTIQRLMSLGGLIQSPLHTGQPSPLCTDLISSDIKDIKPHYHIMINTSNSMNEEQFLYKVSSLLGNDMIGVSIHRDDCGVKNPSKMLRYFFHLDNPYKEQFDDVVGYCSLHYTEQFTGIIVKGLDNLIRNRICGDIYNLEIKSLNELFEECCISSQLVNYWLCQGRNLYLVNSMIKCNAKECN